MTALGAFLGYPAPADARNWTFSRGNCNVDASFDIADPIFLLGYLFAGATSPPCRDACDSNDDGALDIADTIHMLNALFAGDAQPSAPHPGCGTDPTPDGLDCVGPVPGCPEGAAALALEPPEPALARVTTSIRPPRLPSWMNSMSQPSSTTLTHPCSGPSMTTSTQSRSSTTRRGASPR